MQSLEDMLFYELNFSDDYLPLIFLVRDKK